ncbi:MAG TPA: O-antigen ligase family protein [Acidobacteriaceae bacterium]
MLLLAIILSFIVCVWWIAARSITDALIDVYLPIFVLLPVAYVVDVPHVTIINPATAALLPIALWALIKCKWHFQRSDLWLLLFILGEAYPYSHRLGFTVGIHVFVQSLFAIFFPYAVGKLLLEQPGIRQRFLGRMLSFLAFAAVVEVIEFRLGINLFTNVFDRFFHRPGGIFEQIRGGFSRAQGPFGIAITAGLFFGSAWIFGLWLAYVDKSDKHSPEPRFFGIRRSFLLPWLLLSGLVMTLSRGPWMGAAIGFAISRIGYAKRVRFTAIIVLSTIVVAGSAGYAYFDAYTSVDYWSAQTYEQQTAIYRKELVHAYEPIVQEGGLFGWGEQFPRVGGQSSIDNEFLWLRLTQGPFGLWMFCLIVGEAALALIKTARKSYLKSDFTFAISMLGVLCGMLATLLTVSLGVPALQLFFLCIGWSLSMRRTEETKATPVLDQTEQNYVKIFA